MKTQPLYLPDGERATKQNIRDMQASIDLLARTTLATPQQRRAGNAEADAIVRRVRAACDYGSLPGPNYTLRTNPNGFGF